MRFADEAVCGQLTQARAYVACGNAEALANVLRRQAIGRTAQHPDNALGKVGLHFCPQIRFAKDDQKHSAVKHGQS